VIRSVEIPSKHEIALARDRIAPWVRRTPLLELERLEYRLVLKLELLQCTGSFKPRGAFNELLSADVPEAGVIAASGGNFGLAVAYAASRLGHRAEVFIPETSPEAKVERVREHGAAVTVVPGFYEEASQACRARAAETGARILHPFDQPAVVAGQGTIAAEIDQEFPDADTVLVAVGGGGLIGGIASWFRGDVRVVGVEPKRCATMTAALAAGEPVRAEVGGVAADSLGAARVGDIAYAAVRDHVDRIVVVSDDDIVQAQRALWKELRLVVEPGGAAATAALVADAYRPAPGERVVSLVCGSNCDPATVTG
jgi:threonine dehydratase